MGRQFQRECRDMSETRAMSSPLSLSVVLPTYARAEVLRTTLRHLWDQTLDPRTYEVIVVDDGSPDHTQAVVQQAISESPYQIAYLRHENSGPGYTQNRGIRAASAPLILLLADDIFMTRGALEAHVAAHAHHGDRRVAILGNVTQSPELRQSAFQRKWDPFELRRLEQHQELPYWMFWACNISFKRDFMLEHGMFLDARGSAGAAAHEDVEVGHRLSRHGLRIFHEKNASAHHYHPESLQTAIARSYQRGLNWHEAFERMPHPEMLIRQRMYGIGTLLRHHRALTGERRAHLLGADRSMPRLAIDAVLRSILFNRLTVPLGWTPLMKMAERHSLVEAAMRPRFYRGVVVYHFRKGARDAQKRGISAQSASPVVPDSPYRR